MTTSPDKMVFISYRRSTSKYLARLIFDRLRAAGYDVFLDVSTIDNGAFDSVILSQIGARPHFVVLISSGALERCQDEDDWLGREIEEAMGLGRNVVPLLEEGLDFIKETEYLSENIRQNFRRYNPVGLSHEYFDAAIEKLSRFLKEPVHSIQITSPSSTEQKEVEKRVVEIASSPAPTEKQLNAEQYFNSAYAKYQNKNLDGAITDYSEVLRLNPQFVDAYLNRGNTYYDKGEFDKAITDYSEALRLNPQFAIAYNNRGLTYYAKHEYDRAISDYNQAIYINPKYVNAYLSRANAWYVKGNLEAAIADYSEIIHLHPNSITGYNNRGGCYYHIGDNEAAIADYSEVIRLHPTSASGYNNRGEVYFVKGMYYEALKDFEKARGIRPNFEFAVAGMAITNHALGKVVSAKRLWRTLLVQDEKFKNVEWVEKKFRWAAPLVEEAKKLIAKL